MTEIKLDGSNYLASGLIKLNRPLLYNSGAPPTGVGGPKIYLRFKKPKDTYATSRSRRRIHPPTKSGASA
jgi:hypothetical protein